MYLTNNSDFGKSSGMLLHHVTIMRKVHFSAVQQVNTNSALLNNSHFTETAAKKSDIRELNGSYTLRNVLGFSSFYHYSIIIILEMYYTVELNAGL